MTDVRVEKIETKLLKRDWIYDEQLKQGSLIEIYIVNVTKTGKKPRILVRRAVSELVIELFKLEVSEIEKGSSKSKPLSENLE